MNTALILSIVALAISIANSIYTFFWSRKIKRQLGNNDFEMSKFRPYGGSYGG